AAGTPVDPVALRTAHPRRRGRGDARSLRRELRPGEQPGGRDRRPPMTQLPPITTTNRKKEMHMRKIALATIVVASTAALVLAGCAPRSDTPDAGGDGGF